MNDSSFRKGLPWLIAGVLLFLASILLYLYDQSRTDDDINAYVQNALQNDFDACIEYYKLDPAKRAELPDPDCIACELVYSRTGELSSWTNNQYLPSQSVVKLIRNLKSDPALDLGDKLYYQLRLFEEDGVRIVLVPLRISHKIKNNFLLPFSFFGRWQDWLSGDEAWLNLNPFNSQEIKRLVVSTEDVPGVKIYLPNNELLFTLSRLDINNFRFFARAWVLICFILGLLSLFVYFRIYAIFNWGFRYYINGILFFGVILFRVGLYLAHLPSSYIDIGLFDPVVLAFDEIFAPSLGDMTINILTIAILSWILYVHFFKLLNLWYRKIIVGKRWVWPFSILTLAISSYLFSVFFDLLMDIMENSQIDFDFSNLFETSIFSFLVLLDIGVLLLSIILIVSSLLKFNAHFGERNGYKPYFILIHLLSLLTINLLLFPNGEWPSALIVMGSLGIIFATLVRMPTNPILHYDPINYILIVFTCALVATYNVVIGLDFKKTEKAERILERILGAQEDLTVYNFETSLNSVENNNERIIKQYAEFQPNNELFTQYLKDNYLSPNFTQFEVWLYMYDKDDVRLDGNNRRVPSYGPEADPVIASRAEPVQGVKDFYQLPNYQNRYTDLYVGRFSIPFEDDSLYFIVEFDPKSRLEGEELYLSLSLDNELYEDIQLINSVDHAVYRERILYSEKGKSSFPIYLEETPQSDVSRKWVNKDGKIYQEVIGSIGNDKIAVVRYEPQSVLNVLTTFSFIFYFFTLGGLLLITLPVAFLRWMRVRSFSYHMPIKTKIRLGLIGISIVPMFVIIGFIGPFISSRYNEEAKQLLVDEATRIVNAVGQDYLTMHNDRYGKMTLKQEFAQKIQDLGPIVRNDINVYDETGRRIASTQPLISQNVLTSDLMNDKALSQLQSGDVAYKVIDEKVGTLSYFSAYRTIVGNQSSPIGYLNVPYIERQDLISEQVQTFLSYLLNIYLLVFVGINFFAVFLANTFTRPLSVIQQRLEETTLGSTNKPIDYELKDEIGAIVKAYNKMVEKLYSSERMLKQSQRELAWKQMARQVAHEIKNPLTPMRLSLQHLSRTWKEQPAKLDKMFPRVMNTLMVQIDSLVRIANSFHEFAKMPEPKKEKVIINKVLDEVVELYARSEEATWFVDIPTEAFYAFIDRDQLSRCFNNIIKNGLQAIDEDGAINISMKIKDKHAYIYIKDNGKGMDIETQKRIFEPNFSTKSSGMGLGLAIVKRTIESNGGSIDFESQEDLGTTFCIRMPSIELVV